jgi:hypothetical protein
MMLFEEFFKKKKISLDALLQGDPGLFSEFKSHYEQMGEKSFDHTKKFWFNKLRHQYPLPPEVKAEKLRAENQIAEQTVADTLTEPSPRDQAPKLGVTPKFKTQETPPDNEAAKAEAAPDNEVPKEATAKPAAYKPKFQAKNIPAKLPDNAEAGKPEQQTDALTNAPVNEQPETPAKFKPRFKAGVTSSKPVEANKEQLEDTKATESPAGTAESKDNEATPPAKVGFKPRFKAGTTTVKSSDESSVTASETEGTKQSEAIREVETPKTPDAAKLGLKPRFKAGTTTVKPVESADQPEQPVVAQPQEPVVTEPESPVEPAPAKLGFKPRFKAGITSTKPAETEPVEAPIESEVTGSNEPAKDSTEKPEVPATNAQPKPAYKPRFNPNMVKRDPPNEEQ